MIPSTKDMMECVDNQGCAMKRKTVWSIEKPRSCYEKEGEALCGTINCEFHVINNKCEETENINQARGRKKKSIISE